MGASKHGFIQGCKRIKYLSVYIYIHMDRFSFEGLGGIVLASYGSYVGLCNNGIGISTQ